MTILHISLLPDAGGGFNRCRDPGEALRDSCYGAKHFALICVTTCIA
jgi:hypothetical protein